MSEHTPGPWEVADLPHGIVVRTESPKKSRYNASRYAAIGGFDRNDPEQLSEAHANARLIAAAPELLEALYTAEALLLSMGMQSSDAYQQIDAAIAQATGDQP